jgi:membrane dipeptidase
MSTVPADLWVLDGHCDSVILRLHHGDPIDLSPVEREYQVTLPRLQAGRLMGLFMMVGDKNIVPSLQMIEGMHELSENRPDEFALCRTAAEVRSAAGAERIAIVMTIEGQSMFEEKIELIPLWHRMGVRLFSLTHGEGTENVPFALQQSKSVFSYLTDTERDELRKTQAGLTDFGRAALEEMARLGIPCDLAHASDATFWDVMECAKGPVCVTHGSCAAISPHSRNLTDEMLRALGQRGGVIGICFYKPFVHATTPDLDHYVEHVLHALEIMGEDGVGIGTDYDGGGDETNLVIPEPSRLNDLWESLEKHGLSRAQMVKIAHDNFLRMLPS